MINNLPTLERDGGIVRVYHVFIFFRHILCLIARVDISMLIKLLVGIHYGKLLFH